MFCPHCDHVCSEQNLPDTSGDAPGPSTPQPLQAPGVERCVPALRYPHGFRLTRWVKNPRLKDSMPLSGQPRGHREQRVGSGSGPRRPPASLQLPHRLPGTPGAGPECHRGNTTLPSALSDQDACTGVGGIGCHRVPAEHGVAEGKQVAMPHLRNTWRLRSLCRSVASSAMGTVHGAWHRTFEKYWQCTELSEQYLR